MNQTEVGTESKALVRFMQNSTAKEMSPDLSANLTLDPTMNTLTIYSFKITLKSGMEC